MKRKVLALMLALCLTIGLAACGGSTKGGSSADTSGASECAEGFLSAVDKGDYDGACGYCTDEVQDALGIKDVSGQIAEQFTASLGSSDIELSKESEAALNDFAVKILDNMVKEASVSSDISEKDGEFEVPGTITFYNTPDTNKVNTMIQDQVTAMTSDAEKIAAYQKVAQEDGMGAMYDMMIQDMMPTLADGFIKIIKAEKTTKEEISLTIKEVDGSYKIVKTSDNLGNFSDGINPVSQ